MALLGEQEGISLLSLAELTTDKPAELLNLSLIPLIRGKFCEMTASLFGYGQRSAAHGENSPP